MLGLMLHTEGDKRLTLTNYSNLLSQPWLYFTQKRLDARGQLLDLDAAYSLSLDTNF